MVKAGEAAAVDRRLQATITTTAVIAAVATKQFQTEREPLRLLVW